MRAAALIAASLVIVAAVPVARAQQQGAGIERDLSGNRAELAGLVVPPPIAFTVGDKDVPAGTTLKGPVAASGNIRIAGTVEGDVFSYGGDIVIAATGRISGSAVAINGRVVRTEGGGGTVEGETRTMTGGLAPVAAAGAVTTTSDNLKLTAGYAVVALLVGIGVLVFGGRTLDAVADVIDRQFGRSFAVGIAATLGVVPGLALLVVALTLTILGVLLIPFAIVAYALAAIGIVALGFVAAARAAGHAFARGTARSERGTALRALVLGLAFFIGLWIVAALLTPMPALASAARVLAFAVTWAAATVGLGATILSRAGTRAAVAYEAHSDLARTHAAAKRALDEAAAVPGAAPPPEWQTPTPVSGVVAAGRRPSSSSSHKVS